MKKVKVFKVFNGFNLECDDIAPDKSISHRCAIFSLLSDKTSKIENFLLAEDTLASLSIVKQLGANITQNGGDIEITPPDTLKEPEEVLDCGNAGTAIRLFIGFLSGVDGLFILTGDKYLRVRPMSRVIEPLREIGARVDGRDRGNLAPIVIRGGKLKPFRYNSPINSAQVKSALILASLRAYSKSYYRESILSRDHTERILSGMGAGVTTLENGWIEITPLKKPLEPLNIRVPADPSSGFFFAVATAIIPNSKTIIKDVSLNKTRVEAYRVLQDMGADIEFIEKESIYEPIGDIIIKYNGKLKSIRVDKNIAWLIDELPALSIAMAVADGISVVENAKELRVKESDRISTILEGLNRCGIETKEFSDGYEIVGGELKSTTINSYGDHRVAMSFAIAGVVASIKIEDIECINTSFPNFFDILRRVTNIEFED
uniref:3-phosphoshikimate 1-carboxyvinyltransferase n=1 Tax=Alvinella pompejana epibiont 7G3 TaxID=244800 RepID=Q6W3K3_9BACT|nr:3-phosphoshikimate 1-carboxyvinyltransferase [Alvinella pompejana epibiont 7G3]